MNRKYIVSIGVVVSMLSGIASAGFVNDGFERTPGTVSGNGWGVTHSSVAISTAAKHEGSSAAVIPILQTLSNAVGLADQKVWTDFWTIPRPFVSATDAAPAVDPNTSAMFFVSNGYWVVVHRGGTNVITSDVWATNQTPIANDGSTWHHVSVFHDYNAQKWSLFVEGYPLVTNQQFISVSTVNAYEWFSVQNGGGNVSNVTWIDDVLITNRVPASLTADRDSDGMYDAWELMYFGNFASNNVTAPNGSGYTYAQLSQLGANPAVLDPSEPGGTNMLEYVFNVQAPDLLSMDITNEASKAMRLVFNVGENWTYQVVRSSSENGNYQYIGEFNSGTGPARNWFIDPTALDGQKYYYRLVSTNGGISVTNTERAVFYKQPRTQSSVYYWVGVPVDYPSGQNKLEGMLGTQLARGLHPSNVRGTADEISVYTGSTPKFFWLSAGPTWMDLDTGNPAVYTIAPGQGILVTRKTGAVTMTNAVFAGSARASGSFEVSLETGWNLVNWALDTPTNSTGWGLGNLQCAVGDEITINNQNRQQTGRTQNFIYLRYYGGGVWKDLNDYSADISNIKFFPGDAVFIRKRGAGSTTWTQTM